LAANSETTSFDTATHRTKFAGIVRSHRKGRRTDTGEVGIARKKGPEKKTSRRGWQKRVTRRDPPSNSGVPPERSPHTYSRTMKENTKQPEGQQKSGRGGKASAGRGSMETYSFPASPGILGLTKQKTPPFPGGKRDGKRREKREAIS